MGHITGNLGVGLYKSTAGTWLELTWSKGSPASHAAVALVEWGASNYDDVVDALVSAAADGETALGTYLDGLPASPSTSPTAGILPGDWWDALPSSVKAGMPAFVTALSAAGRL